MFFRFFRFWLLLIKNNFLFLIALGANIPIMYLSSDSDYIQVVMIFMFILSLSCCVIWLFFAYYLPNINSLCSWVMGKYFNPCKNVIEFCLLYSFLFFIVPLFWYIYPVFYLFYYDFFFESAERILFASYILFLLKQLIFPLLSFLLLLTPWIQLIMSDCLKFSFLTVYFFSTSLVLSLFLWAFPVPYILLFFLYFITTFNLFLYWNINFSLILSQINYLIISLFFINLLFSYFFINSNEIVTFFFFDQ